MRTLPLPSRLLATVVVYCVYGYVTPPRLYQPSACSISFVKFPKHLFKLFTCFGFETMQSLLDISIFKVQDSRVQYVLSVCRLLEDSWHRPIFHYDSLSSLNYHLHFTKYHCSSSYTGSVKMITYYTIISLLFNYSCLFSQIFH